MIKSIRHVGLRVKDMEESLAFYRTLGFIVVYDEYEDWDGMKLHVVKLAPPMAEDEHESLGACIELIDGNWRNHIAMTVDKVPVFAKTRPSGHKVSFVMAPEGTRIELVEEPNERIYHSRNRDKSQRKPRNRQKAD